MKFLNQLFISFASFFPFFCLLLIVSIMSTVYLGWNYFSFSTPPLNIQPSRSFKKPPPLTSSSHQYIFSSYPTLTSMNAFVTSQNSHSSAPSSTGQPSAPSSIPLEESIIFPYTLIGHILSDNKIVLILKSDSNTPNIFCQLGDIVSGWKLQAFNTNDIIFQHQDHPSLFKKFPII